MAHDGHHHDHHAMVHEHAQHDVITSTEQASFTAAAEIVAPHRHADAAGGHGGGHASMMHMAFHFGYDELVLFPFWKIETVLGLLLSCLVLFALAMLYEGLKILRCEVTCRCARKRYKQQRLGPKYPPTSSSSRAGNNNVPIAGDGGGDADQFKRLGTNGEHLLRDSGRSAEEDGSHFIRRENAATYRKYCCSSVHMLQTGLHVVQVLIGFLLMLVFMTYNVWLCLAVLLGAGVGYYCFAWRVRALTDMLDDPTTGAPTPSHMAVNVQNEQICQDCH